MQPLISEDEYLRIGFEPDAEFEDGLVFERTGGDLNHSALHGALATYFFVRRKEWDIVPYISVHIKAREGRYMIPDICVYSLPKPLGQILTTPPLIWIEILSPEDRHVRLTKRVKEALAMGCPYVWLIDPYTLESVSHTAKGSTVLDDGILRIPGTKIVVPLSEVLED